MYKILTLSYITGSHCTIVAHSIGVQTALTAAEELAGIGVECEV